ncbi:MAG: hypothetical protein JKY02_01520 [Flavobacteriaceae bacterium]|nr:hypothetical protein [Flavobacteriaceae bacterium]
MDVRESNSDETYIEIRKRSRGRNVSKARELASTIKFDYEIVDNKILIDSFFISEYRSFLKDEAVNFTIYVPEGVTIYFDDSAATFLNNIDNVEDIFDGDMIEHYFLMTKQGLTCSDCKTEEALKDLDINQED